MVVDDCGTFSQLWLFPGTFSAGISAVSIPPPPPPPPPPPLHALTSNIISVTSGAKPLCIDQTGSGVIDVASCATGSIQNQMFTFALTHVATVPGLFSMGLIQLANGNNLCLDASANGGGSGTIVVQSVCLSVQTQAGYNQQWLYHVKTSTIRPFYSASLCLDIGSSGKNLVVNNCGGAYSQMWTFLSNGTPIISTTTSKSTTYSSSTNSLTSQATATSTATSQSTAKPTSTTTVPSTSTQASLVGNSIGSTSTATLNTAKSESLAAG